MKKDEYYKRLVLREFYYSNVLSAPELSERIGKSLPLVIRTLSTLVEEDILQESGYAPSSGGRRPATYTINKEALFILSVSMDQLVTRISLMSMDNRHIKGITNIELPLKNNPDVPAVLASQLGLLIENAGISKKKIIGVGIGMPGFIDVTKGLNHSFPLLQAGNVTIVEYLSKALGLPVYIDNDSSVVALAECHFGVARGQRNVMVVNVGWGVGLGMVLEGRLFRGHNGFAGEFSHIPIFNNNKLCSCGKSGCLETEASLLVLLEKTLAGLKTGRITTLPADFPSGHSETDVERILEAAGNGDKFCVELLSEIGYNIGRGIAILIHILNPRTVMLSGRGSLAGKLWTAPVQQALNEHCIPRLANYTSIEVSKLGYDAELVGAAALVMENFLTTK
ncbi:ROK family protein [Chitinophaga horti]|uniref:ROK family protein n=1 Tax=Chitinophaga horti TaxID=2920382 RepID=A0ABY6IXS3_9BACT|nr:ROK family protein [Chitinophaga horti]UYQ91207.1 ROK family protein [Chitinophaga horti]